MLKLSMAKLINIELILDDPIVFKIVHFHKNE